MPSTLRDRPAQPAPKPATGGCAIRSLGSLGALLAIFALQAGVAARTRLGHHRRVRPPPGRALRAVHRRFQPRPDQPAAHADVGGAAAAASPAGFPRRSRHLGLVDGLRLHAAQRRPSISLCSCAGARSSFCSRWCSRGSFIAGRPSCTDPRRGSPRSLCSRSRRICSRTAISSRSTWPARSASRSPLTRPGACSSARPSPERLGSGSRSALPACSSFRVSSLGAAVVATIIARFSDRSDRATAVTWQGWLARVAVMA